MNADGTGQTRLTNSPLIDCCHEWSPDGSKIAFPSFRDGNPEIHAMDAIAIPVDGNGDNQANITNNSADDSDPSWSSGLPSPILPP